MAIYPLRNLFERHSVTRYEYVHCAAADCFISHSIQYSIVPNTADRSSAVQKVLSIIDEGGGGLHLL